MRRWLARIAMGFVVGLVAGIAFEVLNPNSGMSGLVNVTFWVGYIIFDWLRNIGGKGGTFNDTSNTADRADRWRNF